MSSKRFKNFGLNTRFDSCKICARAPAAGEVRIEVKAAAVNPADILFRDPGFANLTSNIVPGMDAAGVVESVGPAYRAYIPARR
jgi:NADPH:quinone reductase-like Zn-dependent oxidoreductase